MANQLRRPSLEHSEIKNNAREVERLIKGLNDGAHPSMLAMLALEVGKDDFGKLGGNFQRKYLRLWIEKASVAFALMINELGQTNLLDEETEKELQSIHRARRNWFESEFRGDA